MLLNRILEITTVNRHILPLDVFFCSACLLPNFLCCTEFIGVFINCSVSLAQQNSMASESNRILKICRCYSWSGYELNIYCPWKLSKIMLVCVKETESGGRCTTQLAGHHWNTCLSCHHNELIMILYKQFLGMM